MSETTENIICHSNICIFKKYILKTGHVINYKLSLKSNYNLPITFLLSIKPINCFNFSCNLSDDRQTFLEVSKYISGLFNEWFAKIS